MASIAPMASPIPPALVDIAGNRALRKVVF